jgi:hypothetical protein
VRAALAVYLDDHLAGSVAGIHLADTLAAMAAHANDQGSADWLATLRDALQLAQTELRAVMRRAQAPETMRRQGVGWLGERITRLTLALTTATEGSELAWLDGLEALALGLQGQAALWRALDVAFAAGDLRRGDVDFSALERRAQLLFAEVDRVRLDAAIVALGS